MVVLCSFFLLPRRSAPGISSPHVGCVSTGVTSVGTLPGTLLRFIFTVLYSTLAIEIIIYLIIKKRKILFWINNIQKRIFPHCLYLQNQFIILFILFNLGIVSRNFFAYSFLTQYIINQWFIQSYSV